MSIFYWTGYIISTAIFTMRKVSVLLLGRKSEFIIRGILENTAQVNSLQKVFSEVYIN